MKAFLYTFLFILPFFGKSQNTTMHKMLSIGYVYQNSSFVEIGSKLLLLKNDNTMFRVGASALLGSVNHKFTIFPKVQGDFLFSFEKSGSGDFDFPLYWILGFEVTNKFAAPKIGFNIFGIVDITGGYGFSFDSKKIGGKELKGLNVNFTINLPFPFIYDSTH